MAQFKSWSVARNHDLCEAMKSRGKATAMVNQLLRSDTSTGANIHEAGMMSKEEYDRAFWQCSKLRKLLLASITAAKRNS
ncbi:MAG: hypothetical protein J5878_03530 [Oscillospiraceae bacterium]|nr:hypothetical protein [Oscillospiraceae bacterium]